MTTNGFFLGSMARRLRKAGLGSVTVSLPSLDKKKFRLITGLDALDVVLEGIEAALETGFDPVKINTPVIKGVNEDDVLQLVEFARRKGVVVRFIEFMPFDGMKNWAPDRVVSWRDVYRAVSSRYELVPLPREESSTSLNFAFRDSRGGVGFIASITAPFCGDCDRIRLTADGRLVPCMFGTREFDLKPLLRGRASDEELEGFIRRSVLLKEPGVEYLIASKNVPKHVRPMHTLGG
jgi:cyclic pyranopterin phosphate synthase